MVGRASREPVLRRCAGAEDDRAAADRHDAALCGDEPREPSPSCSNPCSSGNTGRWLVERRGGLSGCRCIGDRGGCAGWLAARLTEPLVVLDDDPSWRIGARGEEAALPPPAPAPEPAPPLGLATPTPRGDACPPPREGLGVPLIGLWSTFTRRECLPRGRCRARARDGVRLAGSKPGEVGCTTLDGGRPPC